METYIAHKFWQNRVFEKVFHCRQVLKKKVFITEDLAKSDFIL